MKRYVAKYETNNFETHERIFELNDNSYPFGAVQKQMGEDEKLLSVFEAEHIYEFVNGIKVKTYL